MRQQPALLSALGRIGDAGVRVRFAPDAIAPTLVARVLKEYEHEDAVRVDSSGVVTLRLESGARWDAVRHFTTRLYAAALAEHGTSDVPSS